MILMILHGNTASHEHFKNKIKIIVEPFSKKSSSLLLRDEDIFIGSYKLNI